MTTGAAERLRRAAPGFGEEIDHLTVAYAEKYSRHGRLLGMDGIKAPADERAYAAEQARLGDAIDRASDTAAKAAALLDREAHRHEQTSRLAFYITGYEAAHGDPEAAMPMRELGRDHAHLAAGLRSHAATERPTDRNPDLMADFVTTETKRLVTAEAANQNARDRTGRDL